MSNLSGYKTYIIAALIAVATGVRYLGYIDDAMYQTLLGLLGAGGLATMRASVNKIDTSIAKVDKKLLIILPFLLFFPINARAQSVSTLEWDYPNTTLTEVQGYTQSITVNGTLVTITPDCVTQGSSVVCSVAIPPLNPGSNTVSVSASKDGVTAETRIVGMDPNKSPKNPGNPKAKIVITINLGG